MSAKVVTLRDYQEPPVRSQYEIYPLPFFNADSLSSWDVRPTGNYAADLATGEAYAMAFLTSCDGTVGWGALLSQIVADMVRAGTNGTFPDGHPKVNGVVIGFTRTVGTTLAKQHRPG